MSDDIKNLPAILDARGLPMQRSASYGGGGDASYDSASLRGELRNWTPYPSSADTDTAGELGTLIPRSRDADRNQSIAHATLSTTLAHVVGTGLHVIPRPNWKKLGKTKEWADEWSEIVQSLAESYFGSTDCDAAGIDNFYDLQRLVMSSVFMNGGVLMAPIWRQTQAPQRATKYRTAFRLIEIDRLSNENGAMDTESWRQGVHLDGDGEPDMYSVMKSHPGDIFVGALQYQWDIIPAYTEWGRARLLHIYSRDRVDQHRGVPALSTVLGDLKIADDYKRAEMQAAVANAVIALVAQSPMAPEMVKDIFGSYDAYLQVRAKHKATLKAGSIVGLFPGDQLASFAASRPNANYGPFMDSVVRPVTASTGLPMEMVLKNFSTMNYSGQRQMIIDAKRTLDPKGAWLQHRFCNPGYQLWLEEAVDAGDIPDCTTDDLMENWQAWTRADWLGAGAGWVDPVNEVNAAHSRVAFGLSSLSSEAAIQGKDWRAILEQQVAERQEYADAGVPYPGNVAPTATRVSVTQTDPTGTDVDQSTQNQLDQGKDQTNGQ